MSYKCCLNCVLRHHLDDNTICCPYNPGCGVVPNAAGIYWFNEEQAKKSCCSHHWPELFDSRYEVMDWPSWVSACHPELVAEYDEYVNRMKAYGRSHEVYIVEFEYLDVDGYWDNDEIKYTDRAEAIAAAVRESQRPGNDHVRLRHEWWCNQFKRTDSEWIDWEKEANDEQAV